MVPRRRGGALRAVNWRIEWTEPAGKDLEQLDQQVAARVVAAVERLVRSGAGDVVKLRPPLSGYRLRVGDWRISFDRDVNSALVVVRRVRHRREAYR